MEPIPETTRAVDELDTVDDDLLDQLRRAAAQVQELVPACVGLSLTMLDEGVTLTLVASDEETVALDVVQYLDGGPCLDAVTAGEVIATAQETLDERGWHLFATATAARGVASTLSLPVVEGGVLVGGVNLYGAAWGAFDGHHDELAELLGAWAGGAVTNADLSFSTRLEAQRAPQRLRDATRIEVATGILAAALRVSVEDAGRRLDRAAAQAGTSLVVAAELVIDLLGRKG